MRIARECGEHVPLFFLLRVAKFFAVCVAGWQDFLFFCGAGWQDFLLSAPTYARTASRRADCFFMLLLVARQEVAKKRAQAFPLGTPLSADAGLPRRGVCAGKGRAKDFLLSAPTYARTASRRADGIYATSWRFPRSSQERNPGVPPGDPLGSRRGVAASGCLCRQALGKGFCRPVLLEICANMGA